MTPQARNIRLQLGLSNELLDPAFAPSAEDGVSLTAEDVVDLIDSFQTLIYTTVTHRGRSGRRRKLTASLRNEYALVFDHAEISSIYFFFRPPEDSDKGQFETSLEQTKAWISRFLDLVVERIKEDRLEDLSDVISILMTAFEFATNLPAGFSPKQALIILYQLVTIFKIFKRHNRKPVIGGSGNQMDVTSSQIVSVIELGDRLHIRRRKPTIVERDVEYRNGQVLRISRAEGVAHIAFPGLATLLPCKFDSAHAYLLETIFRGYTISVRGKGIFWREDYPYGQPQMIWVESLFGAPLDEK